MVGLNLVHLIEEHSDELAHGLVERLRASERTSDYRSVPLDKLQLSAAELYCNLGEWLLQKTEGETAERFRAIGAIRAAQGIRLHQFVWALTISRNHLWRFLQRRGFADTIVQLYGELELIQMLNQFFDRAVYYGGIRTSPRRRPLRHLRAPAGKS